MIVNAKTDAAVRATVELARRSSDANASAVPWVTIESISDALGLAQPYVLTVLKHLRIGGIVTSQRGIKGGFRLARPPDEITVADVMRTVDHRLLLIDGVPPEDLAYGSTLPSLVLVWVAVRAGIRAVLEQTTIAGILDGGLPTAVLALADDVPAWSAPTRENGRGQRGDRAGGQRTARSAAATRVRRRP